LPPGTCHQRWCLQFLTKAFILSWTGVIRYHGVQPRRGPNQIFVANHTSMIDVVILMQHMTYAVVGQQHTGLVAFIQNRLFRCLDCLWFDRSEARDRERVATKYVRLPPDRQCKTRQAALLVAHETPSAAIGSRSTSSTPRTGHC